MSTQSENPMLAKHGLGPKDMHCGGCRHLVMRGRGDRERGYQYRCLKWDCSSKVKFHRVSWPACRLHVQSNSGERMQPDDLVMIFCPTCGDERKLNRRYVESHAQFDARCGTCIKLARQISRSRTTPVFNGCSPVATSREGRRCVQTYECPNYDACLDHAAYLIWPGFRGSVDPPVVRAKVPETPKRPYVRRMQA